MPEYIAKGTITLRGAVFTITADTLEEAQAKARAGQYDDIDELTAELVDWTIQPGTVEECEE